MSYSVRIGNALGFWGDRLDAASEMLALEPDLDFLTLDFLAEVSMSILALQRSREPGAGWPRDVLEIIRSIAPYWRSGGRCRVITNAGGLDPMACAQACLDVLHGADCADRTVAVVSGDDVFEVIRSDRAGCELFRNLDTGQSMAEVRNRLVTANAYLGAQPIAEALAHGADLVITGRVADPSLTVGACVHAFGWSWDDWNKLAGATVAGHLIECGTQVTGGIATDWLETPGVRRLGFPVAEVAPDGSCVVTKPRGTGGRVCPETVKEQLVYEIADPDAYLSPDVTASLLSLRLDEVGDDRIRVSGARGRPAPPTYKVSATWQDGFWAEGQLTVFGARAVAKARRAAESLLGRLLDAGTSLRESVVECLGTGACRPQGPDHALAEQLTETVLRIAVADDSRQAVERFAHELMPLVTAGPQGITGYAEGRPRVRPLFRFWPCLIERERVTATVDVLEGSTRRHGEGMTRRVKERERGRGGERETAAQMRLGRVSPSLSTRPRRLADIAYARSGDKGIHANIGVIARRREFFPWLRRELTARRVASYFGMADASKVARYELPNLGAVNLVLRGLLASPLRVDVQGKALAQALLEMPLDRAEQEEDGRSEPMKNAGAPAGESV